MRGGAVPCVHGHVGLAQECGQAGLVSGSALPGPCPSLLGMGKFLLISSKTMGKERISSQGAGRPCHSNLVYSLKKLLDLNIKCAAWGRRDQMVAKHLKTADSVRTSL